MPNLRKAVLWFAASLAASSSTAAASPTVSPSTGSPAMGLVAHVTDARSHGVLGDAWLSLDEAIRLANGTLAAVQLSPAEANQLTGIGQFVTRIEIDPTLTPAITVDAPLSPVTGVGMGMIEIAGLPLAAGAASVLPMLLGGGNAWILALRTADAKVSGLHFDSGVVGIDVAIPAGAAPSAMAMVEDCDLHAQADCGIALRVAGGATAGLMLHQVHLHNVPVGLRVDDQGAGGSAMLEAEHVHFDLVGTGLDVQVGGTGGAMSMCELFRCEFAGGSFVRLRRTAASTRDCMVRIVHCAATATADAVDLQGNAGSLTMLHHHHGDLHAAPGHAALRCWPRTARFDLHGSEMEFVGDVAIAGNLFTQRIWHQNNVYRAGTVTFDVDGSLPNLLWNRFENCTVLVPGSAHTPVRLRSCHLVATQVQGLSALAPIALEGCWRSGGSLAGQVTELGAATHGYLAATSVSPAAPALGTAVDLVADTPAGIGLAWVLTNAYERPFTSAEPLRFYGDPGTIEVIALVTGQTTTTVPVPVDTNLLAHEFYVGAVAFPGPGMPFAPALLLPRGGLVRAVP